MERMFSWVKVVENNVDNFVLFQNEGIRVHAIDLRLCCVWACCEGGEESRDFWSYICNTVEESAGKYK